MLSVCLFGTVHTDAVHAQQADNVMEVFWEFSYSGGVNTVIASRYDGEQFYVSLGDLFGALQINVVQEPSQNMVHGFYLQTGRPYELDFNAGRALVGNSELVIDSTEYIEEDLGYFLSLDLMERLFGLTITLDERTLAINLSTPDEMPVVTEARRQASRVIREDQNFLQRNAPLLFDRDRALMSGGVVGYRLSTELRGLAPRASLNLRGGGELLGGDLEMGLRGDYSAGIAGQEQFTFDVNSWRWRYVLRTLPALRQAQIGRMTSAGLRSFSYIGTRISNDPVAVQRFFGSYPMRFESEPGWEVEVYLNNQLIDVRETDATGIVNLSIPITYGSTSVTIREYGPSGEFRETERRIQVPFSFVPPGEVRYNIYAGRGVNDDRYIVQATTSIGLTSWMSAKWGFDYITPDPARAAEVVTNLSWGSLSARLGPSYIITAHAAPGALFRGSLNAHYPSLASITLDVTKFEENRIYNQSGRRHEARATVNAPLQILGMPVNWRTTLSERQGADGIFGFTAQQNVTLNPGVLRMDLGFRGAGQYVEGEFLPTQMRFEPRLGYSFGRTEAVPAPLRGLLFSLRSSFDLEESSLTSLTANFSRRIARTIRLQTDIDHQFDRGETSLSLRLSLDLPLLRTSTGARIRTAAEPTFSQDVSGALSYDVGSRAVDVSDRDWVGRSAVTIRMFVDYNGDGAIGDGEPIIENGNVSFRRSVSTQRNSDNYIVAHNLQAYEQYNLTVDQSRIRNPFWVPEVEEFSFVTDPNVHKVIDIPFVVTGELTGSVLRQGPNGLRAVPGLRLHFEQLDGDRTYNEPVFSDGTFYKLGLFPGTYRAWVDSTQLGVLGTMSDPPYQEFTIAATELGDAVDGIDFVLHPDTADAVADAAPPDAAADDPPAEEAAPDQQPVAEADTQADPPVQAEPADIDAAAPEQDETAQQLDAEAAPVDAEAALEQPETEPVEAEAVPGQEEDDETDEAVAAAAPGTPGEPVDEAASEPQTGVETASVYIIENGLAGLKQLAQMVYGDSTLWPKIWLANQDIIPEPGDVTSGIQLDIPPQAPLTPIERAAGLGYESQQEGVAPQQQAPQQQTPQGQAPQQQTPQGQAPQPQNVGGQAPQQDDGAAAADLPTTHTISNLSQTLTSLARTYYGNGAYWSKIWLANAAMLPNPDRIQTGMTLEIPAAGPVSDLERQAAEAYLAGDTDAVNDLLQQAEADTTSTP